MRCPIATWILRQARLIDQPTLVDVALGDGQITAIAPTLSITLSIIADHKWDLGGRLLLPGLVDAHTHLDKSYVPMPNRSGTLREAIAVWHAYKGGRTKADVERTVRRALQTAIANGTTTMRSHLDVNVRHDLQTVETILAIRDEVRGQIDLQLVALGSAGGTLEQRTTMRAALDLGLDLVGGAPALTDDPHADIDAAFALAAATGKALDLHIDETEDPQMRCLDYVADKTLAHGLQGQVTAGHCCSLAFMDTSTAGQIMDKVATAQLHIITLPSCNLVLMGRALHPTPRGVTLVKELLARGVNVSAASDNVHDPFNPFGNYDLLQIANLNAHVAHMSGADEMMQSLAMVTTNPAQALGLPNYGLHVGAAADLVVVDTIEALQALTTIPPRLATFKQGVPIVRTTIEQQWSINV